MGGLIKQDRLDLNSFCSVSFSLSGFTFSGVEDFQILNRFLAFQIFIGYMENNRRTSWVENRVFLIFRQGKVK